MRERLLDPAVAPVGGLLAGVAAFVAVLLATPPGLVAPYWLLAGRPQNPLVGAAAFATGAAATLGLIALGLVAGLLALGRAAMLLAARRRSARSPAAH